MFCIHHTLALTAALFAGRVTAATRPAATSTSTPTGFQEPTYLVNQPVPPDADRQREMRVREWAALNFVTTVDLFLDSEDLKHGTPTVPNVALRYAYQVGDIPYLGFQSTLERDHWFWIQASSIVSVHFSFDAAKRPDDAKLLLGMRQHEMKAMTDPKELPSEIPLFNIGDLIVDAGDLYVSAAALRDNTALRVGPPCAQGSVGSCLFIRFFDASDDKSRWLVNMNRVVAIRPRNLNH